MTKRKKYILDRKYQLKTTFTIIGIVTLITSFILGAITISVVYNNFKIENINTIQNSIVEYLQTRSTEDHDEKLKQAMREIARKHETNMNNLKRIVRYNRYLVIAILTIIILEGIILYIILIRRTHRVSGPIYVMSNFMREIIDGEYPNFRPLRKNDELKEFYDLFNKMVEKLKEKG